MDEVAERLIFRLSPAIVCWLELDGKTSICPGSGNKMGTVFTHHSSLIYQGPSGSSEPEATVDCSAKPVIPSSRQSCSWMSAQSMKGDYLSIGGLQIRA
jgi:hypothetical protein